VRRLTGVCRFDRLGKATNWAKFIATASIGVIHRGHYDQSIKLLTPYLPQHGQSGSPYSEGGALYALGLIHANHSNDKTEFLLEALRNAGNNEIVQHGALLGIGLSAMATADQNIFDVLKVSRSSRLRLVSGRCGTDIALLMLVRCVVWR
jgi:26S proteasome regulatory subunit N2